MIQNMFELASYVTTIVFARPGQFEWPVLATMVSQYLGLATYWIYVGRRWGSDSDRSRMSQ